jgi:IS30 family transposase
VIASRRSGRWEIDTVASRTYLRSAILSLGERRRTLSGVDEDRSTNVQLTLTGRASAVLSDLMQDTHLSAPELVAIALDRFRSAATDTDAEAS